MATKDKQLNDSKKNESEKEEYYPFHRFIRRMRLAGFGALSYTHEEMEKFIEKMVERGQVAEKTHEEHLKKMRERRVKYLHSDMAHERVAKALEHFDVPNKAEIDDLNEKIASLEKKIEELSKPKE